MANHATKVGGNTSPSTCLDCRPEKVSNRYLPVDRRPHRSIIRVHRRRKRSPAKGRRTISSRRSASRRNMDDFKSIRRVHERSQKQKLEEETAKRRRPFSHPPRRALTHTSCIFLIEPSRFEPWQAQRQIR